MKGFIQLLFHSDRVLPIFRISGHYLIALICLFVPEVGENRFILAGILAGVVGPLAIWLGRDKRMSDNGWAEPLFDLVTAIILVNLIPDAWHLVLLVCIVCAQAPSLAVQPNSYIHYTINYLVLLFGMSFAGYVHDVEGWVHPIIVLTAIFPGLIFYAHWQMKKAEEFRAGAQAHDSLKLIAGGVAHDFNNILTSVSGFSEIALERLDPSHLAYYPVQEVLVAANRAGLLTRQLLSFSGRQLAQKSVLDLSEEIESISGLLRSTISPGIEIEIDSDINLPVIEGDPGQLQQVFLNIILNAAEASTSPAIISVRISSDGKSSDDKDNVTNRYVKVEVKDVGCGIADEFIGQIFDPFYTSKSRGHGLGLAAVQRIVAEHSGRLSVESTVDVGTMVTVSFPITGLTKSQPAKLRPIKKASRRTILIVDDELTIRGILREFVEAQGFNVIEASDGHKCMEQFGLHRDKIRAVFLDLKMSGIDGWQCLDQIREIDGQMPVMVISGFDVQGESLAQRDEFTAFLAKPFRAAQLESSLNALLSRQEQSKKINS